MKIQKEVWHSGFYQNLNAKLFSLKIVKKMRVKIRQLGIVNFMKKSTIHPDLQKPAYAQSNCYILEWLLFSSLIIAVILVEWFGAKEKLEVKIS